ncbi:unnamed protein product [Adineta steineri]|uniref:Chitinase n=1 Tax=Adineta steineri TaxID=433720 RepID=A0A813U0J6_9BILA|nr:unnamed protein product [Adineta steineri]CAF0819029.1 unnamed protein product [Adineta steineri]
MEIVIYLLILTCSITFFDQVNTQNCKTEGCLDNLCCSQFGYCGNTPEHCGGGSTTVSSSSNNQITIQPGDCRICGCTISGDCCSPFGFCGNTADHCSNQTVQTPESDLIAHTPKGDCRICNNCNNVQICCNNTGSCVNEQNQCLDTLSTPQTSNVNKCQPDPSKFYKILHNEYNKFIDCKEFSTTPDSTTVIQWSESNTINQIWQFVPINQAANIYLIISAQTYKALTITSSNNVQQWSYETDDLNKFFQIQQQNDLCRIVNMQTNTSLIVDSKINGRPIQISRQQIIEDFTWKLIETTNASNHYWKTYIDENLQEICEDIENVKSIEKLTLQNCLQWCYNEKRKEFCMWNYNDNDDQIGYCFATNQCQNRTKNTSQNEKYRIYINRHEQDIFSTNDNDNDDVPVFATAPFTNYIDYTKYLLISANDFSIPSEPLRCIDLDPQKQRIVVFNETNEGIRFCDLCPNLPPFNKYPDYFINSEPLKQIENSRFDQCFLLCVEDIHCIGYSYNENNFTCLTFNQTTIVGTNGLVYRSQWITILIKQPIGIIQNWLYTRNTKIVSRILDAINRTEPADTFLQCLNLCSNSIIPCQAITYDFQIKICQFFETITLDNYIQTSYGSVTAFHFSYIYGNISNHWKFLSEDDQNNLIIKDNSLETNSSKSCHLPTDKSATEYGIFYNPNCLVGGGNGCDQNGCQLCLIFKANFEQNLPLCPSITSDDQSIENAQIQIENCMKICSNQSNTCIGFDYDPSTTTCNYLFTYSNWIINKSNSKKRYLLTYPSKTYQFLPDCELISTSISQSSTLEECLSKCTNDCQKVSYNYKTLQCKIGKYSTGIFRVDSQIDSHCFIKNLNENNDLTSIRMAFYRYIGFEIKIQSIKQIDFHCQQGDCSNELNQCLQNCLDNNQCQYISITYTNINTFQCKLFQNNINETNDFLPNNSSEIYYRYFDININLSKLDTMPLFQVESDLAQCYDQTRTINKYQQTYSSLKGYKDSLEISNNDTQQIISTNLIKRRRRRRSIFSDIGNFFKKNIIDPVVDSVKDIVETPIKIGKAIGAAISGDTEQAKKEILDIGIVKDAISLGENAVEFGKALGKGDLAGAGEALLNVGADALSFVPIPGGKIVGSIGKNAIKNGVKDIKKDSKPTSNDRKDDDNKRSEDENNKQCTLTRRKRADDTIKRKCDDDDQQKNPKCQKPKITFLLESGDCDMKSIGKKCEWICKAGYNESAENGASCDRQKTNNKNAVWDPKPACNAQQCGTGNNPYISVETDGIVAFTIYYDKKRKLPIWSFSIHDSKNRVTKNIKAERGGSFYKHPCPQLKSDQPSDDHYTNSGYDRGHLTPSDAHRYSEKASKSSNFFINVAPQDPFTNQDFWKKIEGHVLCHNNKYPASLVATGICPDSRGQTQSLQKLDIPSCFWKMICYIRDGKTHVVGFLSENKLIEDRHNADYNQTKQTIFRPVSQQTIRDLLKSDANYAKNPFDSTVLSKSNRGRGTILVQPSLCANALSLDQTESDAWYNDFVGIKKDATKTKRQASDIFKSRGCSASEAQAMALFMGLKSLDIDDEEDIVPDDKNNDDSDLGDEDDDGGTDGRPQAANCGKRIIGYYPSWGTGKVSAKHIRRLTHIIYAFFEVDSSGQVFLGSADRTHSADVQKDTDIAKKRLEHLLKYKQTYTEQKYMFAVGGWENSQYFSSIAQSPDKRLRFIASSLKLIDEYDLDGIDIDWEHPVTGGAVEGIKEDKQNYVLFMKEIRQALDQHGGNERKYLLSFASAAGQWTLDPGYDLPGLLKYADFVNIMTYDFFGAWESKWGAYTGPPAPLYFGMPPRFSGKTNVDWTIKYYMCKTNQPHQINMGVPFYGRYWKNVPSEPIDPTDGMWHKANAVNGKFEGGYAPWNEIKNSWLTNPAYKQQNHEKSKSSYAYNAQEGIFLGFESPESLQDKAKYAVDKNVGGLMIWAIDQDDDDLTMMNIVSAAPLCQNTDPKATFYKCSPLKDEKRWWTLEDSEENAGMCGRSAPLYKGYYPVCDPDDPGYSCCSPEGFCGFSDKHCKSPGVNYGENPDLLVQEPVRPTINPILWYTLDAPDGKRGRCGRDVPKLDNGEYPICNPDDANGHCCSNGGYCGTGKEFCECEECIDFKKDLKFRFKPKQWTDDGKCGKNAPQVNGQMAICNPDSKTAYCCSASGYCGSGDEFCNCNGCVNYKNKK